MEMGFRRQTLCYNFFFLLEYLFFIKHEGRHPTAVSILRAGDTFENAQGVLRHSKTTTTQIYTATILEEQRLKYASKTLIDCQF